MSRSKDKYSDYLEEYYHDEELSELEAHVLSQKVERKAARNKNSIKGFIRHIIALKRYLLDGDVKWYRKSIVLAALLYFLSPADAIPDTMPFVGFLDDMGVILWTVKFMEKNLADITTKVLDFLALPNNLSINQQNKRHQENINSHI